MNTLEFLAHLRDLGIRLWGEGERLRYSAPEGALTPALRAELAARKAEILALLDTAARAAPSSQVSITPVSRAGDLPASFGQQRLWFLEQIGMGAAYTAAVALHLRGTLDVDALERSLQTIVSRHEILRTTFVARDGRLFQVIAPALSIPLTMIDLRQHSGQADDTETSRLIAAEAQQPFDLARGPLLRTSLLRPAEDYHILLLTMHHIITDGWSFDVIFRELALAYSAFAVGANGQRSEPVLPALPIQYADYAHWQQTAPQGAVITAQIEYWTRKLAGMPPLLPLPTDRLRPPVQSSRGATLHWEMPRALYAPLKALGQHESATLFMAMLAAFAVLLARYTAQVDVPIGLVLANRAQRELEGLIGFFVNTLVLRADLSGNPTFRELLRRVRQDALEAYANQDLPFERLVEALHPVRTLNYQPLFQVVFEYEQVALRTPELPGLAVAYEWVETGTAQYDLSLLIEEQGDGIRANWEYSTDLFDAATIEQVVRSFEVLLWGIASNPDQQIGALPLLAEAERRQLLADWNATDAPFPQDCCVQQLFVEQAARTPEAIAVVGALTYRELNRRSNQLAHYLQRLGVGPEVLVGLCAERSPDMMVGLLGILKAGGAYVPLDPSYPVERLALMLEDAQVAVLLTQQAIDALPVAADQERVDRKPTIVHLDADWPAIAQEPDTAPDGRATPHNLAYVIYTSGSTGRPKGVQITHRNLVNLLHTLRENLALTARDTVVAVTTLSFDIAALELFLPLLAGARLVVASQEVAADGMRLADLLAETGATLLQGTPTTWRLLLAAGWQGNPQLTMLCGGEALPWSLAQQLLPKGRALWNMYGPTETTIWSTCDCVRLQDGTVTLGRPLANTQVYVLDGALQPAPVGVPGELYIGGEGLARGYLHRPELTEERFITWTLCNQGDATDRSPSAIRLYRTGDRVRWRRDGRLEFLDRIDQQVKVRGFRIEPGEIESYLRQHPLVCEAVVVAREDQPDDRRLVAYVVRKDEDGGMKDEGSADRTAPSAVSRQPSAFGPSLRGWLRERIPDYLVPSAFVLLDTLPLTPNGKVNYRALPAPDVAGRDRAQAFAAPRTSLERQVADLWGEVLRIGRVGADDNFFDLGGHSLQAVQMVARLSAMLGRTVVVKDVFLYPTVALLAAALQQRPPSGPSPDQPGRAPLPHLDPSAGASGLTIARRALLPLFAARELEPVDAAVFSYLSAANLASSVPGAAPFNRDKLLGGWYNNLPIVDEVLTTYLGRIAIITLPHFDDRLYDDRDGLISSMVKGLDLAAQVGARAVSLAGLLPSATDYGYALAAAINGQQDLPLITTGHATTAATVVMSIRRLLAEGGRHLSGECAGFLGLGSIGLATLRLALRCLPHPRELILCDLYSKRDTIARIAEDLVNQAGFQGTIRIVSTRYEIPAEFYNATTIVGATNVPDVLDIGRVAPGTLVIDDSWPHCFSTAAAIRRFEQQQDILFTEGGVLQSPVQVSSLRYVPQELEQSLPPPYQAALAWHQPDEITGCIFSSLLTARFAHLKPTLGQVDADACWQHYAMLEDLGFQGARLHCEYYVLPNPTMQQFRQRYGG